jgi:hypothetical protein
MDSGLRLYFKQQPVAKVKGVFIKDSDGVVKASTKVFVKKDSSTVEKIHQVPALPFDE